MEGASRRRRSTNLQCRRQRNRKNARWRRSAFLVGYDGTAFQSHQFRRSKTYRSAAELAEIEKRDPVKCWQEKLIAEGVLTPEEFAKVDNQIKERIRREYGDAEKGENPSPNELEANVTGALPKIDKEILPPGKYRIGDTVNKTLRLGLEEDPRRVIFVDDIEA